MLRQRFQLDSEVGSGSTCTVYKAHDHKRGRAVALKVFDISADSNCSSSQEGHIRREHQIRQEINMLLLIAENCLYGFHKIYWYGHLEVGPVIVFQLLGDPLEKRWRGVLADCGPQMVQRLHDLHAIGVVHRDQKPENWLYGRGKNSKVIHLIDFGLATSYRNQDDEHVKKVKPSPYCGTHMYSSPYAELGYNQSRRDDLIALGYLLLSLYDPLPWSHYTISSPDQVVALGKLKLSSTFEHNDRYPRSLIRYLNICLKLKFSETPPYTVLSRLLDGC